MSNTKRHLDKYDLEAEAEATALRTFRLVNGNMKPSQRQGTKARHGHSVPVAGSGEGRYFAERLHRV